MIYFKLHHSQACLNYVYAYFGGTACFQAEIAFQNPCLISKLKRPCCCMAAAVWSLLGPTWPRKGLLLICITLMCTYHANVLAMAMQNAWTQSLTSSPNSTSIPRSQLPLILIVLHECCDLQAC